MTLFILSRVLLSVTGSAVQKRLLLDRMRAIPLWLATYSLMLVPAMLLTAARPVAVPADFWVNVLAGGLLDAAGNLAMVSALRATDLSIFGPLNAFRPVLALLFGWIFLKESPSVPGAIGVGVTIVGVLLLFGRDDPRQAKSSPGDAMHGILLRLLGLSLSTMGAVFLKRAALIGCAELTLCAWTICGLGCLCLFAFARGENPLWQPVAEMRQHGAWLSFHAATFFTMQWLTIRIFQQTLLAYSFAYFQLAMVLQVILGKLVFREPDVRRRLTGCAVMCAGNALLAWKG